MPKIRRILRISGEDEERIGRKKIHALYNLGMMRQRFEGTIVKAVSKILWQLKKILQKNVMEQCN